MDVINNVIKAIDGNQEAISELYYTTYPKVRSIAVSILKNEDDAEDIVNEFHNPEEPIYVVFNGATDALLREPEDYPWSAVSVQNGVPQLSEVHVTDDSLTITTHDADSWATVDSFTIYKD